MRDSGWLGFSPATDADIAKAQKRLKVDLPPSYQSFQRVTNGWRTLNEFVKQLLPVSEINWVRKLTPEIASVPTFERFESPDDEYFNYSEPSIDYRAKHLKEALQISDFHDALVLLNPQVINATGEWEAWFFANWIPGAQRYRSFGELMQAQFHQYVGDEWSPPKGDADLPTEYIGSPGSAKRRAKVRKPPGPIATLEQLLAALEDSNLARKLYPKAKGGAYGPSPEIAALQKVIAELGRRRATEAIEPMRRMLDLEGVREFLGNDLLHALARINAPAAVPILDRFIDNHEVNLAGSALDALMIADPDKARESALRLLAERGTMFSTASDHLAQLEDGRAIPILLDVARDPSTPEYDRKGIGQMIAAFGREGFDALAELARSPERSLRQIAALGLMYCRGQPVHETLETLAGDPDAQIRQLAEITLQVAGPRKPFR